MSKYIYQNENKERLDSYLTLVLPKINRSTIYKFIKESRIKVNDEIITKAGYQIKLNDEIDVNIDDLISLKSTGLVPKIIYQDKNVIVLDKPAGLLSHSKGQYNPEDTVNSIFYNFSSGLDENRGGIVHRLDRDTSGVMIYALNEFTLKFLQKQFSQRKVKKVYFAVVENIPKNNELLIDIPLTRDVKNPKKFTGDLDGKPAQTNLTIEKINKAKNISLVKLQPKTGRTHQLRVHLSILKTPILGDRLYNFLTSDKYPRMFLHAYSLTIRLPGEPKPRTFISELPKEFSDYLED